MDPCAQTNAQLFLQIHRRGCSAVELCRVRDACLLAMQLYSGLFTGSGKTTLAHEIGTASLAHRHGGSFDLIVAGLLHGAYLVGDWGHYRIRLTRKKRDALRSVIGARAETYVHEYSQVAWKAGTIAGLATRADDLSELERGVSFLLLVEELERLLDYGAIVCFRDAEAMKASMGGRRNHMCRLAERLGHPALGAELAEAIDATLAAELPAEIMGLKFPGEASFRIIPRSYGKHLSLRVYQAFAGQARRVEGELRRRMTPAAAAAGRVPALRRP
jgi:hypothetical protein